MRVRKRFWSVWDCRIAKRREEKVGWSVIGPERSFASEFNHALTIKLAQSDEAAHIVFASMRCDGKGRGFCDGPGCGFDIIADARISEHSWILPHALDMVVRLEDGGYAYRYGKDECHDAKYTEDDATCFRYAVSSYW